MKGFGVLSFVGLLMSLAINVGQYRMHREVLNHIAGLNQVGDVVVLKQFEDKRPLAFREVKLEINGEMKAFVIGDIRLGRDNEAKINRYVFNANAAVALVALTDPK